MRVRLDEIELFDDEQIEIKIGSIEREFVERSAAGVDGVLRIDTGKRGRAIKQKGILRAKTKEKIEEMIGTIGAFQDGNSHRMSDSQGRRFEDICIDKFEAGEIKVSGGGVWCEYEIIYSQLKV